MCVYCVDVLVRILYSEDNKKKENLQYKIEMRKKKNRLIFFFIHRHHQHKQQHHLVIITIVM